MKRFSNTLLTVIIISVSFLLVDASDSQAQPAVHSEFVCPMRCENAIYDATGTCPVCGMRLLNRTTLEKLESGHGYVCPPCGHDCLESIVVSPGACGDCGMQLQKVQDVLERLRNRPAERHSRRERKNVAILIFDGVQIIDYTGPYEVFGAAGFNVYTVAKSKDAITTAYGMSVNPKYRLDDCPPPEVMLVPGGSVLRTQSDPVVQKWLRTVAGKAEQVVSVCNGAFILAKSGLLEGLTATTTRGLVDGLAAAAPNITVVRDKRFVDNGKIVTAGGLSAGIDAALHVVSKLTDQGIAARIAHRLEYDWQQDGLIVQTNRLD